MSDETKKPAANPAEPDAKGQPKKPETLSDDDLDNVTGGQRCSGGGKGLTSDDEGGS